MSRVQCRSSWGVFATATGTTYRRLAERLQAPDKPLGHPSPRLQNLLESFGYALRSDLHDKMYSLTGMAPASERVALDIDYSKPLEVPYFEVLALCRPTKRKEFLKS